MTGSDPLPAAQTIRVTASHPAGHSSTLDFTEWERRWIGLGADRAPPDVHARLLACYGEKHRAYHTLQHLAECLDIRRRIEAPCDRPAEIDIALWFHDAIYQPRQGDNEAQCAAWLVSDARSCGIDEGVCRRLHRLVMVTRHDAEPETRDEAVLLDTDLSILGAATARLDEYDAQVRKEYGFVPRFVYRRKRRQVLEGFLARPRIYVTDEYFELFEAQARHNLGRAIESLA